jgi:triosephosphate isomerase
MRKPLVAGNWKLHGSRAANSDLLKGLLAGMAGVAAADVLVCPPYVYLPDAVAAARGSGLQVGAQDVAAQAGGAFTGEVSAEMLVDVGCSHVIVGHSERRSLFGDSDAVVAAKFAAALDAGLQPILCVGETLAERESGHSVAVVTGQLQAVLDSQGAEALGRGVVAYEPIWAIGTGLTATPDQAQEVHAAIRALIAAADGKIAKELRILYGGSVKASNAQQIFSMKDIDGGLIGGASLDAAEFLSICSAAAGAV